MLMLIKTWIRNKDHPSNLLSPRHHLSGVKPRLLRQRTLCRGSAYI